MWGQNCSSSVNNGCCAGVSSPPNALSPIAHYSSLPSPLSLSPLPRSLCYPLLVASAPFYPPIQKTCRRDPSKSKSSCKCALLLCEPPPFHLTLYRCSMAGGEASSRHGTSYVQSILCSWSCASEKLTQYNLLFFSCRTISTLPLSTESVSQSSPSLR